MTINTAPDILSRASSEVKPCYMSGFGNSFETEALPGALPGATRRSAAHMACTPSSCRVRRSPHLVVPMSALGFIGFVLR